LPTVVLMSTMAGLTLAAMAAVDELLEPVLGATAWIGGSEPIEQVVEGADGAAEQAAAAGEQITLDPVDVRPVRHDQGRFVVEARQIALQQERDLARVCRPREERKTQPSDRSPATG